MRNKYTGQDIRARLENTIIRYNGKPYICGCEGEIIVLYDVISKAIMHRKEPDDPGLDVSSIDLGYMNLEIPRKCAVYLRRNPLRQYRQGVDLRNLEYEVLTLPKHRFGISYEYMNCQGFLDSYEGKFPSFKKATAMLLVEGWFSAALSKDVAILRDGDVFKVSFKGGEVGWGKLGSNHVLVPKTEVSWVTVFNLNLIDGWEITEGVK